MVVNLGGPLEEFAQRYTLELLVTWRRSPYELLRVILKL